MTEFSSIFSLLARFRELGATRAFFKPLSENDNSKQQIYLGGSFEILSFFPHGTVKAHPGLKDPNFKASLSFLWVSPEHAEEAPHTQLILYPKYPEVRLSGFLRGCQTAPNEFLRPVPKEERRGVDGRVLFFGVTQDGRTLAHLASSSSSLALEALDIQRKEDAEGLFTELPVRGSSENANRKLLLERLREIHRMGFVASVRLDRHGNPTPYRARNGGGYTLEALLGVKPNGESNPDFLGWEVKAFSKSSITLMTPEPDGGLYGEKGVAAFIREFGHASGEDQLYFTGTHRVGQRLPTTGLLLEVNGFDAATGKITDVTGSIQLTDEMGRNAASWGFADLLTHWNRKHASAVYVKYESRASDEIQYRFLSPVWLGQHTDFGKYLAALTERLIVFDPGSKIDNASSPQSRVKARSQFRIKFRDLAGLYESFETVQL
ncbi:MvaI/BcnI family restriction endonuclease [Thauera humireducens]|uniref:MvaI/BcnI family restriction endonuclease n=1 Tax=Thauera humireducens TaxID=1134435 RepID=UPI0024A862D2|nr:MvaI/BcnI family restriction endonuclease [Thauera humireducens]